MKKLNKMLSIILSVIMILSIIPPTASAATYSGTCGDNLTWIIDDSKTLKISGTGAMYDYILEGHMLTRAPWGNRMERVIIDEGITSIGHNAFYGCDRILSVQISDTVKNIGYNAFSECFNLSDLTIGSGVEIIDSGAFSDCKNLLTLEIPENVKTIRDFAFWDCHNLISMVINGGDSFGISAFDCNSLKSVKIGENVSGINSNIFYACEELETISVDENNKFYSTDEYGVLFNKDKTTLIAYPMGRDSSEYVIPNSVTRIEKYAFSFGLFYDSRDSSLRTIAIPDSVTSIGNYAFNNWKISPTVYFSGSEEQWNVLLTEHSSSGLDEVDVHYCSTAEVSPTCTEYGTITYTCYCCNVSVVGGIAPTGRITETQILPTCTTHGYTNYTCDVCGKSYNDYTSNPTGHTLNEAGVCEVCGEKEISTNHVNNQMLSIESVFAMVMNLLAKLFGIFTVA